MTNTRGARFARTMIRSAGWPQRSFLGLLPETARDALLHLGTQREYPASSTMAMEGDLCTDVFTIIDGWAKEFGSTAEGRRALLALRSSGDLVGEQAALEDQSRTVSVISAGPAIVRVVGRPEFLRFLMDFPEAGVAVSRTLSAKLRWATSRRIDFSGLPVLPRLARVLSELAQIAGTPVEDGIELGYTLTQPELAAMIGASEPSVHKALRQLRNDRIVETGYRRILICDPIALEAVAGSVWSSGPVHSRRLTPV